MVDLVLLMTTPAEWPLRRWTPDSGCSRIATAGVTETHIVVGLPARSLHNWTREYMNPSPEFFSWLANQSAFVEVVVGVFFCLIVAPALLAGIATAVTRLEGFVETGLSAIPMLNVAPAFALSRRIVHE